MINLIKGNETCKEDFSALILLSAHYFKDLFGKKVDGCLEKLFITKRNLFSYEHTLFAKYDGIIASMVLCYSFNSKTKENLRTGWLLFKFLKFNFFSKTHALIKLNKTVGMVNPGEFYISNIATYNNLRHKGLAKKLLVEAEKMARKEHMTKMILDVESDNPSAVGLYKYLQYRPVCKKSIKSRGINLTFIRMEKVLQ